MKKERNDSDGLLDYRLRYNSNYYNDDYEKYYGGHQFRLGHYFRNLFQAVKLINESELIGYSQKHLNIKLLRGQLSTYEQVIIFLNSLSFIGRVWELEDRKSKSGSIDFDKQLITKYNFIKNISSGFIYADIKSSDYYPLVEFETAIDEPKRLDKQKLKDIYT